MTQQIPLETQPVRLVCSGLMLDHLSIPPFQIRAGQGICLHRPPLSWRHHDELISALTKQKGCPELRFFGSVAYLDRPMPRRRWWGGWYDPTVRDWLTVKKELTVPEAAHVLERAGLAPGLRIGRVGWNERARLAVEAFLLRPTDLLVFDLAGHDPFGIQRLLERLARRPPEVGLLYVKTREGADEPCLPGGTCVVASHHPLQQSIAE